MLLSITNHYPFDFAHIFYLILLTLIIYVITTLAYLSLKKQVHKDLYIKVWALTSLVLHISPLYIFYLQGLPMPDPPLDTILFPIYFCNLSMWLLIITAFWTNKKSAFYRRFSTLTAFSGFIGAAVYLIYPVNYFTLPDVLSFLALRPILSHFAMLMGSLYLIVGNYIKIDLKDNMINFGGGLLLVYLPIAMIVNFIYRIAGLPYPSAMYVGVGPFPSIKWINAGVLFPFMLLMGFLYVAFITKLFPILQRKVLARRAKRAEKKKAKLKS